MKEKIEALVNQSLENDKARPPRSNFESCAFAFCEFEKVDGKHEEVRSAIKNAWKSTTSGAKKDTIEIRFRTIYKVSLELAVKAVELAIMAQRILQTVKEERK